MQPAIRGARREAHGDLNWFGVVAPKGTPKAIVDRLNAEIDKALNEPDLAQRITQPGNVIGGGTPQQFGDFIAGETQRWTKLIRERAIKAD
jgi:tripartite-type tricarboxylate transporter receptor subunit TctC